MREVRKNVISGIVFAFCLVAAVPTAAQRGKNYTETVVNFPSWSPASYLEIFKNDTKISEVSVTGDYVLPQEASAEVSIPAVVFLHGVNGDYSGYQVAFARQLAQHGIASLVIYSYQSRGLGQNHSLQERYNKVPGGTQFADAYAALDFLSDRPEITFSKIYVAGFAYGGRMAYLSAMEVLARSFQRSGKRFAGHVAFYASCDVVLDGVKTTGAPLLLLVGEKDENAPLERCEELAKSYEKAGSDATLIVYPDATHSWNAVEFAPRYFRNKMRLAKCRWVIGADWTMHETTTNVRGHWDDPALIKGWGCAEGGYTMGRNKAATTKSVKDLAQFILKNK